MSKSKKRKKTPTQQRKASRNNGQLIFNDLTHAEQLDLDAYCHYQVGKMVGNTLTKASKLIHESIVQACRKHKVGSDRAEAIATEADLIFNDLVDEYNKGEENNGGSVQAQVDE